MVKEIEIYSESEMIALGHRIGKLLDKNMVIALTGDLGPENHSYERHRTSPGVESTINSPTFIILKVHFGECPITWMFTE